MRVIIGGGGRVGTGLARALRSEFARLTLKLAAVGAHVRATTCVSLVTRDFNRVVENALERRSPTCLILMAMKI